MERQAVVHVEESKEFKQICFSSVDFLSALRAADLQRAARWHPRGLDEWNVAEWSNAMCGEAGEVANIVKKIQRDFSGEITDEIRQKLKDELGDVLWYVSACADELGLTLNEIAEFNVEKLAKRHKV